MATETYAWRSVRYIGLTGTNSVYLTPFQFGDGSYGNPVNLVRMVVEVDAVALASTDLGATYSTYYRNQFVLSYAPGSPGTTTIVASGTPWVGSITDIAWTPVAGAVGPASFSVRVDGQVTTNVFTLALAGRVTSWVER